MQPVYFCLGSSLSGLANLAATYSLTAHVLPSNFVPLTGAVQRRANSGRRRDDGAIASSLQIDIAERADLNTFMNAVFGGWTTPSLKRYMTLIDENGYYSPFYGWIEKPTYQIASGGMLVNIQFALNDLVLQEVTKSANYTVTASDRLVKADTTSGSITLALPAAASVGAYTPFAFVKTASANSLILNPDGSELIDGAATKTLSAQYSRVDIVSNGSAWVTV